MPQANIISATKTQVFFILDQDKLHVRILRPATHFRLVVFVNYELQWFRHGRI
jgi:hypothetical protein